MKKIIAGKQYNTRTAIPIAEVGLFEGLGFETLCKTRRGDFFIYGSGPISSRWKGREDIIAVDLPAAAYWLRSNGYKYKTSKERFYGVKEKQETAA